MKTPKAPKVKLTITQEILDAAERRDSRHCAIADAVKVARPDAERVSVDVQTIRFTDPARGLRFTYLTPRIAQVHLVNFDQARPSVPFDFQLRGGQVNKSGNVKSPKKPLTSRQREQRRLAGLKLNQQLRSAKMVQRKKGSGNVPDRIGGKTPPLQGGSDGVPFTHRRAFGLRGMEM